MRFYFGFYSYSYSPVKNMYTNNNSKKNNIDQIVPTKIIEAAVVSVLAIVMLYQIDGFQYLFQYSFGLISNGMSDIKVDGNTIKANAILATNSSQTTRPGLIVGSEPRGIATNPNTDMIYVANNVNGTVSVIEGKTNKVVGNITVGDSPEGVAVNPVTDRVYVANTGSNGISIIDGKANKVVDNITGGGISPKGIAVNPETNMIYVANSGSYTVSVINDTSSKSGKNSTNAAAIFKTITVGKSPGGIAVNPETDMIYVANRDLNSTAVIDGKTNRVVAKVTVGPSPYSVAVNPTTNLIYVSNRGFPIDNITTTNTDSNTVSVIDGRTNKVVANLTVGYSPEGVAVNPVTNKIYVANSGDYSISVIDGINNKVVDKILTVDADFGNLPLIYNLATYVAVNPKTNTVYLTNEDADTVSVIDGKNDRMLTSPIGVDRIGQPGITLPAIRVGLQPHGLAVNPETNIIYVPTLEVEKVLLTQFL
jgi:YVTN family beta-propeller protein